MAIAHPRHWHRMLRTKLAETHLDDLRWVVPRMLNQSLERAARNNILADSQALSFTFILSLVPLLTIAFTIFKWFGGLSLFIDKTLKPFLAKNFPDSVTSELHTLMDKFVANLETGALGAVSFATLLATVIALMMNIETSFNRIFETKFKRALIRRIGSYWVMLSAFPFVIVLSTAKSSQLMTALQSSMGILSQFGLLDYLRFIVGHLVQIAGFGALFVVLPEKKPRLTAVFWGALVTHLIFQLLAAINVQYASFVFSNRLNLKIYGSLPLLVLVFLIWVRLVWLGILFGACLCASIDKFLESKSTESKKQPWMLPSETILNCVRLLEYHIESYRRQDNPLTEPDICALLNLSPEETELHHERLVRKGYVMPMKFQEKSCFSATMKALSCSSSPEKLLSDLMDIPKEELQVENSMASQGLLVADVQRVLLRLRDH
ncbi:MAG: YihY/virulence factor BrkB family protein [Betaproteobacteria bacterium]|nr:YihY/virulence factor BrkB family protein [Betaproteobacteria bacterium]